MTETNKRYALKKQIREQGLNIEGKSFPEQMTALYEGRIQTTLSTADVGEKYLALQGLHDEMQAYINQNNLVVEKRKESRIAEGKMGINLERAAYATGTVMVIAACVALVAPAGIIAFAAGCVAGIAGIFTVAGAATVATTGEPSKEFEKLANEENKALAGLSGKVEKEMTSLAEQTPAEKFLQSIKASSLVTIHALKDKLHSLFNKSASNKKDSGENNTPNSPVIKL